MIHLDELRDKIRTVLHRHKDDEDYEPDEIEPDPQNPDDIGFANEEDAEDEAKQLKRKHILAVGGAVVIFAAAAVGSNMMSSPADKKVEDKPIASDSASINPAKGLPNKYSDISKYQSEQNKSSTASQQKTSGQGQRYGSDSQSPVRNNPASPGTAKPVTYSSPPSSSAPVSSYVPPTTATVTSSTPNTSGNDERTRAAAKEREAFINSAIAFKVASDIAQGKTPESAANEQKNESTGHAVSQANEPVYLESDNENTAGSYALQAGSVIQATLLTGITSDVPNSDVVAQVRQNIYDSETGEHLLIPQGSRLIGTAGSAGSRGNKRVGVSFNRIILPNGTSITLPKQQAIDGTGMPGMEDEYTDHSGALYKTAFMTSLLSAVAQSATGGSSGSDTRSSGQEAVSGAAANVLNAASKIMDRDSNINPTVTIRPGMEFSVFINQDLMIGEYSE